MIIRKPYAFLIKHFKKIHIFLLVLCAYIYYINMSLRSFVKDFMSLGTYDSYLEPITKYLSVLTFISLILIIASYLTIIILLKHKNKPWKLYILPLLEYIATLIIYIVTLNFFNSYTGELTTTTTIRAIRDFLFIIAMLQYPVILLLIIRILGIDLNKFNFKSDKEYLELNNSDREEIEINIDIDKESFKRLYKRLKRNIGYVYKEHKYIINCLIAVSFIIIIGLSYKYFFITNKVYQENETLNANSYSINIKNVYITDKDKSGNIIEQNSNFIIVDLNIKNNTSLRQIDFNKFHIINGINDYTYTSNTYQDEFSDLGTTYDTYEIGRDKTLSLILVYKVNKKLDKNKFALYYQEINGYNKTYLRKIKVNVKDVSVIKEKIGKKMTDTLYINDDIEFAFEDAQILDSTDYNYQICPVSGCVLTKGIINKTGNNKILKITYSSEGLEGKDMIDFSSKYGKIIYKDSNGKTTTIPIENYLTVTYYGKYLYLKVPEELENAQTINFNYVVRNNKYIYKIR